MIQKYGFSINVYQTRRTACAPQWVYDNTYQNALNGQSASGGPRFGLTNIYGGVPCPIPDTTNPLTAGVDIVWNHLLSWKGQQSTIDNGVYSVINGQRALITASMVSTFYPYYQEDGTLSTFNGYYFKVFEADYAPPDSDGFRFIAYNPTDLFSTPLKAWELLTGQGRIRKVPDLEYDVPESQSDGLTFYDESDVLTGSPDRYDWKLLGKKEMYLPYNTNGSLNISTDDLQAHFINPDEVRWELRRVWVVDATLHPGDRHSVPHRRMYIQEDTWAAITADEWDAQGNLWKVGFNYMCCRPDVPGTVYVASTIHNFQQNGYVYFGVDLTKPPSQRLVDFTTKIPPSTFLPQTLSSQGAF